MKTLDHANIGQRAATAFDNVRRDGHATTTRERLKTAIAMHREQRISRMKSNNGNTIINDANTTQLPYSSENKLYTTMDVNNVSKDYKTNAILYRMS